MKTVTPKLAIKNISQNWGGGGWWVLPYQTYQSSSLLVTLTKLIGKKTCFVFLVLKTLC